MCLRFHLLYIVRLPECVTWLIHMCDMTHSYVWHIHMCDMPRSYVWHDWFVCVTWHHVCVWMCSRFHRLCIVPLSVCATWLIHVCDMIDSCISMTSFIHTCDMIDLHAWHVSSMRVDALAFSSAMYRRIAYACDLTHSCVWTWWIHMCDMIHSYVWQDWCTCVI